MIKVLAKNIVVLNISLNSLYITHTVSKLYDKQENLVAWKYLLHKNIQSQIASKKFLILREIENEFQPTISVLLVTYWKNRRGRNSRFMRGHLMERFDAFIRAMWKVARDLMFCSMWPIILTGCLAVINFFSCR